MKKHWFVPASLGCLLLQANCTPYLDALPDDHRTVAKALTNMQWYVQAYGFGVMSAPLIVNPDPTFRFNPRGANPDAFFSAALTQVQVRHAGSTQGVSSGGTGLSAEVDVPGLQKGLATQADVAKEAALLAEKRDLLAKAARREYEAAKTAAQSITDPVTREQAIAAAERALATNLPGPSPSGTPTQMPETKALDWPTRTAPSAAGLLTDRLVQKLYSEGTPAVTNEMRNALVMAAGDTATHAILSMLSDPDKISQYSDKLVLFAISTVSVNPGWLTRENFAADVSARFSLDYITASPEVRDAFLAAAETPHKPKESLGDPKTAKALKKCIGRSLEENIAFDQDGPTLPKPDGLLHPFHEERFRPFLLNGNRAQDLTVTAVSPMADSQMLDLQGSVRRQRDFALQIGLALRYIGIAGAADSFLKWADLHQEDAESRTANVVVNGYSIAGGMVGFQIGPRLAANPRKPTTSAMVEKLDRQSFPALFLVGFDKESLRPRVEVRNGKTGPICRLMEPRVSMRTYANWLPLNRAGRSRALTEEDILRLRLQAGLAFEKYRQVGREPHLGEYRKRWEMLRAKITGAEYGFTIPLAIIKQSFEPPKPPEPPKVSDIVPNRVEVPTPTSVPGPAADAGRVVSLLINGTGLGAVDLAHIAPVIGHVTWVNPVGVAQEAPNARRVGESILLTFQVGAQTPTLVFALPLDGARVLTTPPLSVVPLAPPPSGLSTITVERRQKDGNRDSYTFSPDVSDEVKKTVIERDKPRQSP